MGTEFYDLSEAVGKLTSDLATLVGDAFNRWGGAQGPPLEAKGTLALSGDSPFGDPSSLRGIDFDTAAAYGEEPLRLVWEGEGVPPRGSGDSHYIDPPPGGWFRLRYPDDATLSEEAPDALAEGVAEATRLVPEEYREAHNKRYSRR